ncbi:MAG: NAD(P)H-dependent oxidoreductase subunit E [Candidatus Izimaplasma sp.]|nr:NAD(P)H-dependent oxidoreductase subunit E [Candidatus Izimaplasma bacterium]
MLVDSILNHYPKEKDYVIEILLDVQKEKEDNFISQEEVKKIAYYLDTTESHVCSVLSFYTLLSTKPRGKNIIQVCKDVPCYVRDDFNLLKTVKDFLGVNFNETTTDRIFTLETTACIGCCDEAPVMRINDRVYKNLTKDKAIKILKEYRGNDY